MTDRGPSGPVTIILGLVGVALHLVVGSISFFSGLVAPVWAVVVFMVVWGLALGLGWRLWRRRPWTAVVIPVVNFAFLLIALQLGDLFLGWTA